MKYVIEIPTTIPAEPERFYFMDNFSPVETAGAGNDKRIAEIMAEAILVTYDPAETAAKNTKKIPSDSQMAALIESLIVPSTDAPFEQRREIVVTVDDEASRARLLLHFAKVPIRIDDPDSIVTKKGVATYRITDTEAYANHFSLVSSTPTGCVITWSQYHATLGGFSKTVTLKLIKNHWVIISVRTDFVA